MALRNRAQRLRDLAELLVWAAHHEAADHDERDVYLRAAEKLRERARALLVEATR